MTQDADELSNREQIAQIRRDIQEIKASLESAFVRDDTGLPDYVGHRIKHKDIIAREKDVLVVRASIVKNIVTWAIIGVLTIVGSNLAQTYLTPVANGLSK